MPTRPALIRSLERHRAASRLRSSAAKPTITEGLMVSWIHHDNMLEGVMYRPDEIATALRERWSITAISSAAHGGDSTIC